jgi:hypothetical protein
VLFSVISISMLSGGRLVSRSASSIAFNKTSPWNCGGKTLIPMRPGESPIARQAAAFWQAV